MRWDPYHFYGGNEFNVFWKNHLDKSRKLLFIIGRGFDVRMLSSIRFFVELDVSPMVWLLAFQKRISNNHEYSRLFDKNLAEFRKIVPNNNIKIFDIQTGIAEGRSITSRQTKQAIERGGNLSGFTDIVVDVSAMPRMVALTVIAKILFDLDNDNEYREKNINLHVVTEENVSTDVSIQEGILFKRLSNITGFSGALTAESSRKVPRVWLPVLGENQENRLRTIHGFIDPDDVCPVIPFPSSNPRRGDDIFISHRKVLLDEFGVDPKNILRASELNPFEGYKQIFRAIDRYKQSFNLLGGCKAFVSPMSSKLLTLASLLACYDHKFNETSRCENFHVGIPYVETEKYTETSLTVSSGSKGLCSMWIKGEWENEN